ncbi:MAG: galactose-1-phosphate uridylyltransferase [Omnitrophica WOR_2 bacterium RIFCSPHIGHO2_02_FULL_68_15]|nr:MAG: galactose-1-phosphate uridylyltransferase [Omnitrophica WOR_2 bacterium RIFCSPHIGHO2_02_FULL_68_15]
MPELRKDPIVGRWVIVATERARRPDQFLPLSPAPVTDTREACLLCEGQESRTPPEITAVRRHGTANQPGWTVRVVPANDPILRIEGQLARKGRGIYDLMPGVGAHELIIETPQHVANLADVPEQQIEQVIGAYVSRLTDLERDARFKYALLYKNYGRAAGSETILHTHSEIMAMPVNPVRLKDELYGARQYFELKERCIFCDIMRQELESGHRVAVDSREFVAFAPFASRFPFELWILPRRHAADFTTMRPEERADLAVILKATLQKLRQALRDPPYNFILHTAPFRRPKPGAWHTINEDFHWHMEIMPRLTRVAGFEWGSGFYINPTPPEEAAKFLRELEVTPRV